MDGAQQAAVQPPNKINMKLIGMGVVGFIFILVAAGIILFPTMQTAGKKQEESSKMAEVMVIPKQKLESVFSSATYKQLTKGVYATTKANVSNTVVQDKAVDWKVYTYTVNGKEISLKIPQDETPPTQEEVENLYQ